MTVCQPFRHGNEVRHGAALYLLEPVCTVVLTEFDPVDLGHAYIGIGPMSSDALVATELQAD